eukprot:5630174-Prymnesium_polylepis.1
MAPVGVAACPHGVWVRRAASARRRRGGSRTAREETATGESTQASARGVTGVSLAQTMTTRCRHSGRTVLAERTAREP